MANHTREGAGSLAGFCTTILRCETGHLAPSALVEGVVQEEERGGWPGVLEGAVPAAREP